MDIQQLKNELAEQMEKTIGSLKKQMTKVRTGRANTNILDGVTVSYYGTPTPLKQLGQVSTPEARLLQIQPYDKTVISDIEKAILAANLGVTPSNDGNFVRIPFPALTEEKRKEYVKGVKKSGEDTKVALRNLRRDYNEKIKKEEKSKAISEDDSKKYQEEVQKVLDQHTKTVDEIISSKEKELLTV